MKYNAEDFNYTFVSTTDADEAAAAAIADPSKSASAPPDPSKDVKDDKAAEKAPKKDDDDPLRRSSRAGDHTTKPYIYTPPKSRLGPSSRGGTGSGTLGDGEDDYKDAGGALIASLGGTGACCCCVCALFLIAGGVMVAYERSRSSADGSTDGSNDALLLAGIVVLIIAVAAFLLGCCACCFSCVAACAYPPGGGGGGGLLGGSLGSDQYEDEHRDIKVQFRRLNDRYDKAEEALHSVHLNVIGDMKEVKEAMKKEDKARQEEEKTKREELEKKVQTDLEAGLTTRNMRRNYRPIAFLIRFEGDMMLSNMELLRKQVSIIVNCGRAGVDRAVVVVTSPGGAVSPYGLAASQLVRIRKAGIQLIVCVDTVAASGGYMMASVGDTICAAPFAVIGSIGVVTQIPNFQRFLNKHDIDAFLFTAGKHKRTVDVIGDVTEEGKAKLQEELDDMHRAFKDHVALARPSLKDTIEDVATGEYWVAVQAKEHGLVDEIMTSDEYLESICRENEIIEIIEKRKKTVWSAFHAVAGVLKGAVQGMVSPQHRHGAVVPSHMAMARS